MNQRIYETHIEHPGGKITGKWHLYIASVTTNDALKLHHDRIIFLAIVQFDNNLPLYEKLDAAVNHYKPFVEYTFFSIGERYGQTEKSKVLKADTIIKNIVFIQNNKKYNLLEYLKDIASQPLKGPAVNISMVQNLKGSSSYNDFDQRDNFISPDSSKFYNDNLDLDQQSPEFWDDIT